MWAIIGALVSSTVATKALLDENSRERGNRNYSRQNGCEYYIDRNGKMRHTDSGQRYTAQEVYDAFYHEDRVETYKKKVEDIRKKQFYAAWVGATHHFFLTKEESIEFVKHNNETVDTSQPCNVAKLDDRMYSKLDLDGLKILGKFHFNYDEYVGELDKPWEKK